MAARATADSIGITMRAVAERTSPVTFDRYAALLDETDRVPGRHLDRPANESEAGAGGRSRFVPRGLRPRVKAALSELARPRERRRAAAMVATRQEIKLNLGCGYSHLEGWVNVDADVTVQPDMLWDLRRSLPFPDGSVAAIFHEHLLEHLPLAAAAPFTRECWRVLRPGGILRIGVPDFERYARDYLGSRELIDRLRPGRPTALLALSELAFCYQHMSMWDQETLVRLLHDAGLASVQVKRFGETTLNPIPDRPWREAETIYVEAVKADSQ